jgi:hypothetical protein
MNLRDRSLMDLRTESDELEDSVINLRTEV